MLTNPEIFEQQRYIAINNALPHVDASGPYADFIYDGRKGIGYNYNDRA